MMTFAFSHLIYLITLFDIDCDAIKCSSWLFSASIAVMGVNTIGWLGKYHQNVFKLQSIYFTWLSCLK